MINSEIWRTHKSRHPFSFGRIGNTKHLGVQHWFPGYPNVFKKTYFGILYRPLQYIYIYIYIYDNELLKEHNDDISTLLLLVANDYS